MSSLLPPNATAMETTLETVTERAADLPVDIRQVWNPDTCPAELLPWLAWALSIDTWRPEWSEATKRQRIQDAISIHRRKGTLRAVQDAVAALAPGVTITEWWQTTPRDVPHTFAVELSPAAEPYAAGIYAEVNRTKPVRSQFSVNSRRTVAGSVAIAGALRVVTYRQLICTEA